MDSTDTAVEGPEPPLGIPDITVSVNQVFGLETDIQAPAFSQTHELVPDIDEAYCFDHETTLAIMAGFAYNRRGLQLPCRLPFKQQCARVCAAPLHAGGLAPPGLKISSRAQVR